MTSQLNVLFLFIFSVAPSAHAQLQRAQVKLSFSQPNLTRITIESQQPLLTWSFLNSYGEALGLGDRVQNLQDDSDGEAVAIKRIAAGMFRADRPVNAVKYEVRLTLTSGANAAHVSWLKPDGGVLMLADLLPLEVMKDGAAIDVMFDLPDAWEIRPSVRPVSRSMYLIDDPMNAVFSISPSFEASFKMLDGTRLEVAVSGDWPFREAKVIEAAAKVLKKYSALTRFRLHSARILILPMPRAGAETWQAQTRGSTLVLLLDRGARFQNWIAQLEVIFTHELLHFWVPNALQLQGDYDWFFEGFTLYQALLTALELKVISFDEYLNTIARAYDSYLSSADTLSLIEASEKRWTGASSAVYDKGMLLAFLYDLELRYETRGESRLSIRYAELFRRYAAKTVNANDAIMSLLISSPGTERLLRSYVENRRKLELAETIKRYGLAIEPTPGGTDLKIVTDPTQDQRRLLKSLGYRR
jgi:predicted metalloprotease with PDZ domain